MRKTFIITLLALLAVFTFVSCNDGVVVDYIFAGGESGGGGGDTPTYTVTLNVNGGKVNSGNVTSYTKGEGATLPTDVTKENHEFAGWFDNEGCMGTAVTAISKTDSGDKTFYAKWTPIYTVTLNVNGGTINSGNVTSYTYGVGATLPTDVTRSGYEFDGWFDNEGCTGTAVTTISNTDSGNKAFYAKWKPANYTVTLNVNEGTINSGNVTNYTYGVGATLPTDVTREDHIFGGWYANQEYTGTAVTSISNTDTGNKTFYAKWAPKYLAFESASSFSIRTHNNSKDWDGTLEYSTDASTWTIWNGTEIASALSGGNHVIYIRGTGNTHITGNIANYWVLGDAASNVECKGDIRTLLDYANPDATVMGERCFINMFMNWNKLLTAPALPATTLANACYHSMFYGCSGLTTAPELPATILTNFCYYDMFHGCSSLTTAPALPATTLASNCYYGMFNGCTNLNSITCLATDISAASATSSWVYGVAAEGTFTKAPSMTGWGDGSSGIPAGWTVQNYGE